MIGETGQACGAEGETTIARKTRFSLRKRRIVNSYESCLVYDIPSSGVISSVISPALHAITEPLEAHFGVLYIALHSDLALPATVLAFEFHR